MYARSSHLLEWANYQDFGRDKTFSAQITYADAAEGGPSMRTQAVVAPGVIVNLATYTTIHELFVWNEDSTNYVTATYFSVGGGGTAGTVQTQRISAGQTLTLVDVSAGLNATLTLIAPNGNCYVTYVIVGL